MSETEDYSKSAIPTAHKTTHQAGGDDEVTVEGLTGELVSSQKSAWAKVADKPATFAPSAHKASHEKGGSDALTDVLRKDGSEALTADWDTGGGHAIKGDKIRARDSNGLKLEDDGGNGLEITDGGIWHGIKQSGCGVVLTTNQTISHNTWTQMELSSENWDIQNEFNVTTYRFTASKPGKYMIIANASVAGLADTKRLISEIRKNGSGVGRADIHVGYLSYPKIPNSTIANLVANDYIEFFAFHNHGSDLIAGAANSTNFLRVAKIA